MRFLFLFFSCFTLSINAQTFVDIDAVGNNDGSSWTDAFVSLNDAIDLSTQGDEIWVAEGTYVPNAYPRNIEGSPALTDRDFTFHLKDSVAIYGGFQGDEIFFSERNLDSFICILDGAIDSINFIYSTHVVLSVLDSSQTILDGFTITRGLVFVDNPTDLIIEGSAVSRLNGGGMINVTSQPTLHNIKFSINVNIQDCGGGMYNDASSPNLNNVSFNKNAAEKGAGMCNVNNSNPTIIDSWYKENEGIQGMGMYNDASSPVIHIGHFELNSIGTYPNGNGDAIEGAGMYNSNGSNPSINACTFTLNFGLNGPGMYNSNSNPHLINVKFTKNFGDNGDNGGMYNVGSNPILEFVTFSINSGVGLYNLNSAPTLINCTLGENIGNLGGGMYNNNSSPIITGGVIVNNKAFIDGGGMYNINGSNPIITNVVIGDNAAVLGGGMYNESSDPVLEGVTLINNEARFGGGMQNENSMPILNDVVFTNNRALKSGGGMNNENSSPTLTNVLFTNNQTIHINQSQPEEQIRSNRGGGMNNYHSEPSLNNVTFRNNEANYGGGMSNDSSEAIIYNVKFVNNEARDGGGLFNLNSSPTLTNVSFNHNRARGFVYKKIWPHYFPQEFFRHKGGGLYVEGNVPVKMTNVVFNDNIAEEDSFLLYQIINGNGVTSGNVVSGRGGGFYFKNFTSDSLITIINATFHDNSAQSINDLQVKGDAIYNESFGNMGLHNSIVSEINYESVNISDIDGTNGAASILGNGNYFYNIQENFLVDLFRQQFFPAGSDDVWGTADDGLLPVSGSPIINLGVDGLNLEPFDIAGQARIMGDSIDIGAYEFTICNDTTTYVNGVWTNGIPTPSTIAIFDDDYHTLNQGNGSILACTCIVSEGNTLTIGDQTALHVYFNGINLAGNIIIEEGGSIINGISN
jgi:hypothetical protein